MIQLTEQERQQAADKQTVNLPQSDKEQKQTDPNMTELKGFTDDKEKLEPEGTDNPDVKGMP